MVAEEAAERHVPAVTIDPKHRAHPPFVGRRACNDGAEVNAWIAGLPAVAAGRVAHADADLILGRALVAERFEPRRRPRAAPAGVEREVGVERLPILSLLLEPDAGDRAPVRRGEQAVHPRPFEHLDVREREHAGPERRFQQGAADRDAAETALEPRFVAAELVPAEAAGEVTGGGARLEQFGLQAGEERLHGVEATGEQTVHVAPLGHAFAVLGRSGEVILLHDRHALEAFAQHARGQQPGHAAADHDGVCAQILTVGAIRSHGNLSVKGKGPATASGAAGRRDRLRSLSVRRPMPSRRRCAGRAGAGGPGRSGSGGTGSAGA